MGGGERTWRGVARGGEDDHHVGDIGEPAPKYRFGGQPPEFPHLR